MSTTKVTDGSFATDVLASATPVLVDFWAEWCGPCKMIGPALEELSEKFQGRLTIAKLNIDDNPSTPTKYGVQAIPTLLLFKDGKVADKQLGALPKGKLTEWLERNLQAPVQSQA